MFACAMIGVTRLGYFSKGFMKNFLTKKHFGICLKTSLLNKKTCNWYTLGNFFCPITWSHWSVAWPVTHQGTLECKFKKVWLKIISKKNFFCCVTHLERWISVENTMEGENVTFYIQSETFWNEAQTAAWPVWPDLANFHHFITALKTLAILKGFN